MTDYAFNGKGRAYDVPARDIPAAEFDRMNPRQQRVVLVSGWYDPVKAGKSAAPKAEPAKTGEPAKEGDD